MPYLDLLIQLNTGSSGVCNMNNLYSMIPIISHILCNCGMKNSSSGIPLGVTASPEGCIL